MEDFFSEASQIRKSVIFDICSAPSLREAFILFARFSPLLAGCNFVFAADAGPMPGLSVNRDFSCGGVVRSRFRTRNVVVLDSETIADMSRGAATFKIDYSISLDTEAVSYLEPFIKGRHSKLPKDIEEVFAFIARDEVNVDPLPYLQENLFNIGGAGRDEKIFQKLIAYEKLRNLDTDLWKERRLIRSKVDELELIRLAQRQMSRLYAEKSDANLIACSLRRHNFVYAMLIKMAIIQIRWPRKNLVEKLQIFLEFCNWSLATMAFLELLIAKSFFTMGQKLGFFRCIHKGHSEILKKLHGMAWDVLHIRHLEQAMSIRPMRDARYFFSALLTFDGDLVEVINLCTLKSCAFVDGMPLPFYTEDITALLKAVGSDGVDAAERYFSLEAGRDLRRPGCEANLSSLVDELENELLGVAG